jgi:tetratricopeptide (TPR) repeat protein
MAFSSMDAKRDILTQRLEHGGRWLVRHWQQVLLALGALAVAGAFAALIFFNLQQLQSRAWEQLSTAQGLASRGQVEEALKNVEQLAASHRSGPLASQARLFKGDLLFQQGKGPEAAAAYQEALERADSPELQALALAGLAGARELAQTWDQAATHYERFIKDYPEHFLTPRAYEALGRIQMTQGRWKEAQATFERLITLYPTTPWAKDAQTALAQIKPNVKS